MSKSVLVLHVVTRNQSERTVSPVYHTDGLQDVSGSIELVQPKPQDMPAWFGSPASPVASVLAPLTAPPENNVASAKTSFGGGCAPAVAAAERKKAATRTVARPDGIRIAIPTSFRGRTTPRYTRRPACGRGASGHALRQRRRPESNRCKRLCRPLRNHSATAPEGGTTLAGVRCAHGAPSGRQWAYLSR